uniref:Uncharacterized protein n=1 Tax=Acrobeloides nanus TaxID=290746 RepID=A0A914EAQ8_9BILA
MCTSLEFAQGNLKYIRSWFLIAVSIVMLVIYALLWLLFKTSKDTSIRTRKILKSLTVITIIIASSYPSSQIIIAVSRLCFTPETFIVIAGYCGFFMIFSDVPSCVSDLIFGNLFQNVHLCPLDLIEKFFARYYYPASKFRS